MHIRFGVWMALLALGIVWMGSSGCQKKALTETNRVLISTSLGEIELELYPEKAPVSVENFLTYVREGFYDNTIFHRVIEGFMIQGGGFDKDHQEKVGKHPPIENEAANGLSNEKGTIAYARTNVVNSATSQWFINRVDNTRLDHRDESPEGYGYAVFGKVVRGMDVVEAISAAPTGEKPLAILYQGEKYEQNRQDVPLKPVIVKSVRIVME